MRGPLKLTLHLLLVLMIGYNIIVIHSQKTTCTFSVTDPTLCVPFNFCTDTDNCTTESSKCCCKEGYDQNVIGSKGPQYTIECSEIDECFLNSSRCGPNSYCVNTVGSYSCVEFNTTTQQPTQRTSPPVTRPQRPRSVYEECSPEATQGRFIESCASQAQKDPLCSVLESSFRSLNESCQTHNITIEKADKELLETTERFTEALTNFSVNAEQRRKSQLITELLYSVEQNVLVSFLKTPRAQKINTTDQDITMKPSRDVCSHGVQSFSLVSDDNIMEVPCSLMPGDKGGAILIAYKRFDLFTPQVHGRDDKRVFHSKVVTGTITNVNTQNLSSPIIFSLSHLQPLQPLYKVTCVYWDPVRNDWSDEGCGTGQSDGTHTNCSCTHLSSFALLMAPDIIQEDSILTLLSYIGLSLSLLCLCLSLLTFILCRSLRSSHTSVLIALCGCLFLGQLLFLVGIRQTGIQLLCAFIAGCLQFSFLCAFCWMSIESFLLFMTVRNLRAVNYMASRKSNFPLMCFLGFGIPALIVGITAAVRPLDYGTHSYCWLSPKIVWSFLGPVCVFIITNTVLLVLTVYLLRKRLASVNTNISTLSNTRLLTFKAVAQLFILGCTWGIGYFQFGPHSLIFSYLFTICNSLQGVYIFLVHCLLNQQVRGEYRKLLSRKKKQAQEISTLQTPSRSGNASNITMPMSTISSSSTDTKAHWL